MNENLVSLLTKRYNLEQKIRLIEKTSIVESKQDQFDSLLAKLKTTLTRVNEEILKDQNLNENHNNDHDEVNLSSHPDHEVQMARSELYRAAKSSIALSKMLQNIDEEQGLEGWVQAKITRAADYLDSVYHYLEYEMKNPSESFKKKIPEAVAKIVPYGPGQTAGEGVESDAPSPTARPTKQPAGPGQSAPSSGVEPPTANQPQTSPTPPAGGSTPVPTAPGMVKMLRVGPGNVPLGAPITVPEADIEQKQRQGYKVVESASAGATGAGAIASTPTGFASGGIGMQKRKKKKFENTMTDAEKESTGPTFTGYYKGKDKGRPGKKMVGDA